MPLNPLSATLSEGQKLETLKRFRAKYSEELAKLEAEMQEILTSISEADFLAQYLGEQPEIAELRSRKGELEAKEKRRQYLGKIIDRLDASIPQQAPVAVQPPAGGKAGLRRY
ncbi:MAG: hypothetical protein H0V44_10905 [Planctomycetes bacterium]|nr:hypothetical protein [Planctomycetota bacterium]